MICTEQFHVRALMHDVWIKWNTELGPSLFLEVVLSKYIYGSDDFLSWVHRFFTQLLSLSWSSYIVQVGCPSRSRMRVKKCNSKGSTNNKSRAYFLPFMLWASGDDGKVWFNSFAARLWSKLFRHVHSPAQLALKTICAVFGACLKQQVHKAIERVHQTFPLEHLTPTSEMKHFTPTLKWYVCETVIVTGELWLVMLWVRDGLDYK